MARMIQVRNVPEELHRELTRRARARGQTLTRFVEDLLEREVARPAPDEVFARINGRPRMSLAISAAELIHDAREEQDLP